MKQEPQNSTSSSVSAEVQDFYERYPYPRPIDTLEKNRQLWQDRNRRRAEYHLFYPNSAYREDRSILVAGCGTSQAAKYAIRWPEAQVTGIDFSATSVRCTDDLKRKCKLDNLQLTQLPIERAGELNVTFDQIVCTGVLHHLPDPDAGLRALRSVLNPDGAMHLMVYAPYGRTGIYMLQEFCKLMGIHATDTGIRDLIAALKLVPPGHPLERLLRDAPDFRTEAALADALLHPQDRAYSVPQFFDFVEKGGFTFGRWIRQAPYSPLCGVLGKLPQASAMAQLPLQERFAAAELFRGSMLRHSAVAYRSDHAGARSVHFRDDAWLRYVPIRMTDTIAVQERLPPGAAAVLINQRHTDRDLFTPIDSGEKALLDSIDGQRTIADIAERHSSPGQSQFENARRFFEFLWWADQVVFDTSQGQTVPNG